MEIFDDSSDPISPAEIGHHVDEIWADKRGGELEQCYNFLDYHFDRDGAYMRARAYVDEMSTVTIFGPFASRTVIDAVWAPALERDVREYLGRRFQTVKRL
jgi:hypothetical protein